MNSIFRSFSSLIILALFSCQGEQPVATSSLAAAKECAVPDLAALDVRFDDPRLQSEGEALVTVGPGSGLALLGSILKEEEEYWPNGVVTYRFHPELDQRFRGLFLEATALWERGVNHHLQSLGSSGRLRFVEDVQQIASNYVLVVDRQKRSSSAKGMNGGEQFLRLKDIASMRTILHELGHTLGLAHEHSRCDRDDFIEVLTGNIQAQKTYNFNRWCKNYDVYHPYNVASIMHYSADAYSCNGKPTMRLKSNPAHEWERAQVPHDLDYKTIAFGYLAKVFRDAPLPPQD